VTYAGCSVSFGCSRIWRNHARSCVMLVLWHFLAWGRVSVGLLRHLGKEENGTRNFPCVFYTTLSDVRWNTKRARRNFQAQQKKKKVPTHQLSWVPVIPRYFQSDLRCRHNVAWHCFFSIVNPAFKRKNCISHNFCVCSFKCYTFMCLRCIFSVFYVCVDNQLLASITLVQLGWMICV